MLRNVEQREAMLEAILFTAADSIITIDERGIVESANPVTEKLFGYTPEELLGQNIKILMPPPYHQEHDGYLVNYLTTGQAKIIGIGREVVGKRKDGSTFPMELAVSEVQVGDRRFFTGIVRDVTERKKSEEQQASVGRIIEDSLNEVFIFDADTLLFVQANRGARENLDYSMDELRTLTPLDIKPDYTMEKFVEVIAPLTSGRQSNIVFYTRHQRKNGSCYDVEIYLQKSLFQGKPCFVAIILDITDRRNAEASLRVQERALESAVNGIFITDPNQEDNPIVYVNSAMHKITGYSPEEVIGRNCRFLQKDSREQEALTVLRNAIVEARECKVVLGNFRKNGTPFWTELTVSPVFDNDGKLVNFVGIQSDITERKEAEEALAQLNRQLEQRVHDRTRQLEAAQHALVQKEKLAMLGQVSGGIAHEIKNPLNAIKTSAYYLLNAGNPSPEKVKEHLERIERQVNIADNVISALSKFAKLPDPEVLPVEVKSCLVESLATISLPDNIEVVIDISADAPLMMVDNGQLMIVFRNLIRNARDAMLAGGKLTFGVESNGPFITITVQDTGDGIPPEIIGRVLEPLYSTKARGMGLGLAISRAIVEKHHGELSVTSEVGVGSRFVVKLKSLQNGQA